MALAVKNEEQNLASCLSSIQGIADEIIVVDGGSTDKTIEIAKKFNTKVIQTDNPLIFHINKQKALDACQGIWILQLDADEVVTDKLQNEIKEMIKSERYNGYYIPRKNYFWGHFMRKGGQYPDYVIRLVKRGKAVFPCKSVHEQIEIEGEVGYLKEPLLHYAYKTKNDYWRKADAYTTLTAWKLKQEGIQKNLRNWAVYVVFKPIVTFFTIYIRHKGFVDGWYGLVFAYWSALHFPIAWKKYVKNM